MSLTHHSGKPGASRGLYAAALVVVVLLGLVSRRFPQGIPLWDEWLGDALYASAAYLALAALRPKTRPRAIALAALGWCVAVELFQLTGIPARYAGLLPVRLLFGTTFALRDLACYTAGAGTAFLLDRWARKRRAAD
ncbi:MAG: DUF2809 domain-containing protein [Armatimonadota bacterium]